MTKTSQQRPTYHIGTVARLTGLSTHTIRVWERRYAAVEPARSPGGTREYSEADVAKLSLLKNLTDSGHAIGQIAQLTSDDLRALIDSARQRGLVPLASDQGPDRAAVAAFMYFLERMDLSAAETALNQARQILGPLAMVFDVLAPICQQIGDRWYAGTLRIVQEHAATAILRNFLAEFVATHVSADNAPVATATTLSGELHELGALMASFVASTCGYQTVYLGPDLPVSEIAHAVTTTKTSLLLLSLVNGRDDATLTQLDELLSTLPGDIQIIAGGRSADAYADVLSADQRITSLPELYEHLGGGRVAARNVSSA